MKTMSAIAAAVLIAGLAASSSAFAAPRGHGGSAGNFGGVVRGPSGGVGIPSVRMHGPAGGGSFANTPRIARPFAGGGGGWQGKSYPGKHIQYGGNFGKHHHRRHRGLRFYSYGAPFLYDDYAYSYDYADDGCYVYWNRYLRTGNPKWKYRYYDCID
jgi:hypothetical protein